MSGEHATFLVGYVLLAAWCLWALLSGLGTILRRRREHKTWWRW